MKSFRPFAALVFSFVVIGSVFGNVRPVAASTVSDQYTAIREYGIIFANICPDTTTSTRCTDCHDNGKCTIQDMLQVGVNLSYLIFALCGSAALIAFVYGGLEWITSAGQPERVKKGKQALVGAVVGLAIIFFAYIFIDLLISVLKTGSPATGNIENTIGGNASDIITTQ